MWIVLACVALGVRGLVDPTCVANLPSDSPITFCGHDGNTYAVDDPGSAINCGLGVLYRGECGCPNNCMSHLELGKCSNAKCECMVPGFVGADCTDIDCSVPGVCGEGGECVDNTCKCAEGLTGPICQQPQLPLEMNDPPYGQVLGPEDYYNGDEWGDHHPLFDRSHLAVVQLEMDEAVLRELIDPVVIYTTNDYQRANITLTAGAKQLSVDNVGVKIKGTSSVAYPKKSFKISFDEFGSVDRVFGLKKLGLKANGQDMSFSRNMHEADMLRAVGAPHPRHAFAALKVNGVFHGLYWMHEIIDKTWVKSRFGSKKGNFYKTVGQNLGYLGEDPEVYRDVPAFGIEGLPTAYNLKYEYKDGWEDLIDVARILTIEDDDEFYDRIADAFDIDLLLRTVVVRSAVMNWDSFSFDGNNWMMFCKHKSGSCHFSVTDFDQGFDNVPSVTYEHDGVQYSSVTFPPHLWGQVWVQGVLPDEFALVGEDKLIPRVLSRKKWMRKFVDMYEQFLDEVFNAESQLFYRTDAVEVLLRDFMPLDLWFAEDAMEAFTDSLSIVKRFTILRIESLNRWLVDMKQQLDNDLQVQ